MICSEQELREAFDHFDENDNGELDRQEFGQVMAAFGAEMNEQELKIGFEEIDTDGSGAIDFDEFWSWMCDRYGG
jgi:Ca2+-binding EF-hand superfamily protein